MVLRLDDAETITKLERREVLILVERPDITITWSRYAAGERGPDLHVHREHTDAFYVLDGELTLGVGVGLGAERIEVGAGGFVSVPPNVVHTFVNDGSAEARWLNLHAPDQGFAAYLRALRDGVEGSFDSFDPPADGGLPATGVIVTELPVTEWTLDGPLDDLPDDGLYYELPGTGRVLSVHAPDGGFADVLLARS